MRRRANWQSEKQLRQRAQCPWRLWRHLKLPMLQRTQTLLKLAPLVLGPWLRLLWPLPPLLSTPLIHAYVRTPMLQRRTRLKLHPMRVWERALELRSRGMPLARPPLPGTPTAQATWTVVRAV